MGRDKVVVSVGNAEAYTGGAPRQPGAVRVGKLWLCASFPEHLRRDDAQRGYRRIGVPSPITPREEKGFASINENPESSIHFRRGVNEARTR